MNTTTDKRRVSLEELTKTYKGTTEYNAYSNLGKERREITGILGVNRKANAFKIASWIAKPFSIIGSAFGFATITTGIANQEIFSNLWFILLGIGLFIGAFFEYLSTANEDSLVGHKITQMTKTGIILVVLIKVYAIYMHYQTAEQIQNFLLGNNIKTPMTSLIRGDIISLESQIKAKQAEITPGLIKNTTSIFKAKREDAIRLKSQIEGDIARLQSELKRKRLELVKQSEADKEAKISENSGLVLTFFILLVIFEVGGTLMSILHKKTILLGVDETIATAEEIKQRLYSKKAGLEETTNRLNAFRVADEIKANHNAITLMELETKIREDELILLERAKLAEIDTRNKELELKAKIEELEGLKYSRMVEAIDQKINQIQAIEAPLIISEYEDSPQRKMGFVANLTQEDMVKALYANGEVKEGDKLVPKTKIINKNRRREDEKIRAVYNQLLESGIVEYRPSRGYYAKADYETALKAINGGV